MTIRKALLAAAAAMASAGVGACGGANSRTVTASVSTANWVTHADPVTLLPQAAEVFAVLGHASTVNRYDQALNATTVNPSFGPRSSAALKLASGAAELSLTGPEGSQLYAQVFEFKTLDGARSLASAFLAGTRLRRPDRPHSLTPGEQQQASRQPYGRGYVSFRYAFREQNVLCLVELDGPRGKYTLSGAIAVAALADRHIASGLS